MSHRAVISFPSQRAGRGALVGFAAVAFAAVVALGGTASAATTTWSSPFSGTINSGDTVELIDGASIDGAVTNNGTLQFNLTLPLTGTTTISGTGNVLLTNTGTVTFTTGNSYLGGTTIHFGNLVIAANGTVGHPAAAMTVGQISGDLGVLTISGGSVSSLDGILGADAGSTGTVLIDSGTWSVANELILGNFGSGSLSLTGGLVTTGSSSFLGKAPGSVGTATVSGGTWNVASVLEVGYGGVGSLTINGGSVTSESGYIGVALGSSGTATVTSGTWATLGDMNVGFYDGTGTLNIYGAGVVSVNGTLNRGGAGTILLDSGGRLLIGTGADSGVMATDLANNGAVVFNRSTDSSYDYLMSGTGTVTKLGAGRLTYTGSNSYSGGTLIEDGILDVSFSGGIHHAAAGITIGTPGGGVGGLDVTGGSVDASTIDLIRGTFNLVSGTVATGNATIATGTATISGGGWSIANDLAVGSGGSGSLVITDGLVTSTNTTLGATLGDVGTAVVTGGRWNSLGNITVGGAGSGSLDVSGSGIVAVEGTLSTGVSGTVTVGAGGTLYIGSGGTSGLLATDLTNDGSVIFNRSDASVFANSMSGSGEVQKQGAGALTFSGSSSYTGATAISAGSLFVNGQLGATPVTVNNTALLGGEGSIGGIVTVEAGGIVAAGSTSGDIATLSVGGLSLLNGAITQFTVSGTDAGGTYDQITGLGAAQLDYDGTMQLVFTGTYADQTTFHLFSNFTTRLGNFQAITLSGSSDFHGFGFTDPLDSGLWVTPWTANNQRLEFNTSTGDLVVVPEPATLAMAVAGAGVAGFYGWRRGRSRGGARERRRS